MKQLLNYGLYLSDETNEITVKEKKYFGVFTTYTRSNGNIHGCHGYWNREFILDRHNVLTPNDILKEELLKKSRSSAYKDGRRQYTKSDIYGDEKATLKVSWMENQIWEITDTEKGMFKYNDAYIYFDNSSFGILCVNSLTGNGATYLPEVFPSYTPWIELRDSIKDKADFRIHNGTTKFYAYKTTEESIEIKECLIYEIKQGFIKTLNDNLNREKSLVPFSIDQNGLVEYDPEEKIRNAGLLTYLNEEDRKEFRKGIKEPFSPQSMAFLLLSDLYDVKLKEKLSEDFRVNYHSYEERFELPEVLIALITANDKMTINIFTNELYPTIFNESKDVFHWNWQSQLLFTLYNNDYFKREEIEKLAADHYIKYDEFDEVLHGEINHLAVFFESVAALHYILKENYNQSTQLASCINKLVKEAYNQSTRLFHFKSNGKARLDITQHIVHGIDLWIKN